MSLGSHDDLCELGATLRIMGQEKVIGPQEREALTWGLGLWVDDLCACKIRRVRGDRWAPGVKGLYNYAMNTKALVDQLRSEGLMEGVVKAWQNIQKLNQVAEEMGNVIDARDRFGKGRKGR